MSDRKIRWGAWRRYGPTKIQRTSLDGRLLACCFDFRRWHLSKYSGPETVQRPKGEEFTFCVTLYLPRMKTSTRASSIMGNVASMATARAASEWGAVELLARDAIKVGRNSTRFLK